MIKRIISAVILVSLVSTIFFSLNVQGSGGSAGVGVINVPPEYSVARIVTEDGVKKIYLTISDYNNWRDIYTTTVTIKNRDVVIASFIFRQYETIDSFTPIAEFQETTNTRYLLVNKCSYSHSDKSDSVSDRCLLDIVFAFYPVPGTQLSIVTHDRGGLSALTYVEYDIEGFPRSTTMILLPWMSTPIDFSAYTIDALAVAFAVTVAAVILRKRMKKSPNVRRRSTA